MNAATRLVKLARRTVEAEGICSFELVDSHGGALPPFSAGSHIDVHLAPGLVRQYSLCNDPRETHRYLIAVLLESAGRGGSARMHALEVGQELRIGNPRNHFVLNHEATHSLLLAGGIGITPILCMAEKLASIDASFELHYFTRSLARTAFSKRIRSFAFGGSAHLYQDDVFLAPKLDATALISSQPLGTHLYVCGPAGFMEAMLVAARTAGWPEECLHREYFATEAADASQDRSFEVQLASTGNVIHVPADRSVTAALAAVGIEIPTSCGQGVCGTCLTRIIEGIPDHRDTYLTPQERTRGDLFTPCCSRANSPRLVIDI